MLHVVGQLLLSKAVEVSVNYIVPKAVDYMERNIPKAIDYASNYAVKKFSEYKNSDNQDDEVAEIDASVLTFQILEIINKDGNILNDSDEIATKVIVEKLLKNNPEYVSINGDFVEEIIKGIRIDVNLRYSLLEELKKRPQIIEQKTSAIFKTACANIGITDEFLKIGLKHDIEMIKKILELHKDGASVSEIFKQLYVFNEEGYFFAFEFEIKQFIKIFETK